MTSKSDARPRPRVELEPTNSIQMPGASDAYPRCAGNKAHNIITNIRATGVVPGLRRLPAGFYIIVCHSGLEWRTENKPASVNGDVEWNVPLPIPLDSSATVCLEVYASFELQPMLGTGEQLRRLTITVEQVLDRSERHIPFTLLPKDGDVVSPCSSITVTTERCNDRCNDSSAPRMLSPLCSITSTSHELEDATNHGHSALSRYRKGRNKQDLEGSVVEFERALNACPLDHPCRAAAQSNLAMARFILCQVDGTNTSFQALLSLYHNVLATRPVGHADRPSTLIQLAAVYLARSEKERNEVDGARVLHWHEVIGLQSTDHGNREVAFMLELCAGDRVGLDHAGDRLSMDSRSESRLMDEDTGMVSVWLLKRFQRYGDLADLERAIALLQTLVGTISVCDERYSGGLGNLGAALLLRFKRLGEVSDIEGAISTLGDAVRLTPDDYPDKLRRLNALGISFRARFERLGERRDIEEAVSLHRDAVRLTPDGHPQKPRALNNLASSFFTRFSRLGELRDLEEAISICRDAVRLTPDGHSDKLCGLNNLANSFIARFSRLGELRDLEEAISTHRDAVRLIPDGHPDKPGCLSNLGLSFRTRFLRLGELRDIEEAVLAHKDAVRLTPDGHPDKPDRLDNLGLSFRARFERLGELWDFEKAIATHRDAVRLTPDGHPGKPSCLNNLGLSFITHFEHRGRLRDLEQAISTHKDAVRLTPDGHPHKLRCLNNLANSFITRFSRLGELRDLEEAISAHREAVSLTPDDHPDKLRCLCNLANSFIIRFSRLGRLKDLEEAISIHREAVRLIPDGHPDRLGTLSSLGRSFRARFSRLGELRDLEEAISIHREAVCLIPDGHPDKPHHLNNLGLSFSARFSRLGELRDLEESISTYRDAVRFVPGGHPDKPGHLNSLANSFITRFERLGEPCDLESAISLYSHSASFPIGPIHIRFQASRNWIQCAQRIHHPSLLSAYSIAINLLPQLAWIGLSLAHRYAELKRGADLVREAAAAALDSGFPELAVEWLEQGRSIVWGELLQLRGSYDQLSSAHPEHARRLLELFAALDDAGAAREKSLSTLSGPSDDVAQMSQQKADQHRRLAIERDELLNDIRHLPGFRRFLLPNKISQLRASAHSGPVVVLNAAQTRSDALIILSNVDHVIHVPLPNFNFQRSLALQNMLVKLLGHARVVPFDDREGNPVTRVGFNWESLLSALWSGAIKPVLDALAFSTLEELSRIFWCPTGPFVFLPIHAAGLYGTQHSSPGHKVSDFVVSSYVPTLSILARSSDPNVSPTSDLCLLTVPQPSSDGQISLRGVAPELRYIRTIVDNSPAAHTTLSQSSVGTVEEVLGLMKDADWVHFACHGVQDDTEPTNSGLCLADRRRLKISDIIGLSRSRDGLAFLSACQTAMGDKELSDEAIHVAAGMLFAGYGGVIGTMWSISDRLAPVVARDVYKYLFRNGTRPDYREAAWALHDAVGRVREGEPFAAWLPFIHVGL